jgi:hypothetical protein
MTAILSVLFILALSLLITRIAAIALSLTGLSKEAARFQARSSLTGVGFTTGESEQVVNHPVRRRIILLLMLLGNAGIVSVMASLIIGFVDNGGSSFGAKIALLFFGVGLLWLLSVNHWLDQKMSRVIEWALNRFTSLEVKDYATLLRLSGEYRVSEIQIQEGDWLADRTIGECRLRKEGVAVLGIQRGDTHKYFGAPTVDTRLKEGDLLVVYGRAESLKKLDKRRKGRKGDEEHFKAVENQQSIQTREKVEQSKGES